MAGREAILTLIVTLTNPDSPVLRSMMARGSNLVSISVLNPPDCMGKWDGVSVCP